MAGLLGSVECPLAAGRSPGRVRSATRSSVALEGVRDGAHRVEGQLVAELPLPGEAGRLVGLTGGAVVVVAPARGVDLLEDAAQGGLAEAPDGAGRETQAVVAAGDEALSLQLSLELAQRLHVGGCVGAEMLLQALDVDIVEGRAEVALTELLLQLLEVGELGDGVDGLAPAEGLAAPTLLHGAAPVEPRSQRAQVVGELRHLGGEVRVAEGVGHELGELLALLRRERGHQPLGRGLTAGEGVDELVDALGLLGEEVAVLVHEVAEAVGRVLVAGVGGEQVVEVGEHVLDPLHRLRVVARQRLPHPLELRADDLALEHLRDLVVGGLGLG